MGGGQDLAITWPCHLGSVRKGSPELDQWGYLGPALLQIGGIQGAVAHLGPRVHPQPPLTDPPTQPLNCACSLPGSLASWARLCVKLQDSVSPTPTCLIQPQASETSGFVHRELEDAGRASLPAQTFFLPPNKLCSPPVDYTSRLSDYIFEKVEGTFTM